MEDGTPMAVTSAWQFMTSTEARRWQRVKTILGSALELPIAEQAAFIETQAGGDGPVLAQLQQLLKMNGDATSLLDHVPQGLLQEALEARIPGNTWIGKELGPYRLVELIARGGMGQVYKAQRIDGQFEQEVAIKLMRDDWLDDTLHRRFLQERQTLANLNHPNLAKLLHGGITAEGVPYFAMEFVQGLPIDLYCRSNDLTLPQVLGLLRTLCLVVDYAHQQGVVHRDLKAANVLVTADGVVKLVDFGIAKSTHTLTTRTATVQQAITLACASPEQVRGETATVASDIYSLGVLLYTLLTHESPYLSAVSADENFDLRLAICQTQPRAPSRVVKEANLRRRLQGDLDAVVLKALHKKPEQRYASAQALAQELDRHLEGRAVQARLGWQHKWNKNWLRSFGMAGAASLAVAGVVWVGQTFPLPQAQPAELPIYIQQEAYAQQGGVAINASGQAMVATKSAGIAPATSASAVAENMRQKAQAASGVVAVNVGGSSAVVRLPPHAKSGESP
jgi:eukaryotic-like serine/threonine-protein kinase